MNLNEKKYIDLYNNDIFGYKQMMKMMKMMNKI
jgi:hypothetical protein